jgi:hypothetical protein
MTATLPRGESPNGIAAISDWPRENPDHRDEAWLNREVLPKLNASSVSEIAKATGPPLADPGWRGSASPVLGGLLLVIRSIV